MNTSSDTLAVGVIGIGFGQQVHVPAFRADGRCFVRALCASTSERAEVVARRLGVPEVYGDWRDLVAAPGIDVVSVAVPPPLQPDIVRAAAAAGKHVFCEKPAGADAPQAEGMLQAVEASGVRHAIDFLFPELPAWQRAAEILASGALGALRHAHLSWRTEIYALRHRTGSWKVRGGGGGTLNNFVSHSLYYLEWLFGPVAGVRCRLGPDGTDCEAQVDAWLDFASGLHLSLSVAVDAYLGSGHRLEVYGTDGALVLENSSRDHAGGFRLRVGRRPDETLAEAEVEREAPGADARVRPVSQLVSRLVDGVLRGAPVTPNLAHGLRVQKLIEALRRAHESGRRQVCDA